MVNSRFENLHLDLLELDINNPRIAELLDRYDRRDITPEHIALALGTSEEAYENLKSSIKENGGIINPIVVQKKDDGKYLVIEGNTRVQIYRKFLNEQVPGNWSNIPALIYENITPEEIHAIRLQAHLIGAREWTPFAQAKYVHHLFYVEKMSMSKIVEFCGGKKARIQQLIAAYDDIEKYYRPLCDDDTKCDIRKFSSFMELQRPQILRFLEANNITKTDFVKWVIADKFDRQEHIRNLPEIWKSKDARQAFLSEGSDVAIKMLNVEEYADKELKNISYERLALALAEKLNNIKLSEITGMREGLLDAKLNALLSVQTALEVVFDELEE